MCVVENRLGVDYWPVKVYVRRKLIYDLVTNTLLDKPIIKIYVTVPIPQSPCNIHLYCEVLANPPSESSEIVWSVGTPSTVIIPTDR